MFKELVVKSKFRLVCIGFMAMFFGGVVAGCGDGKNEGKTTGSGSVKIETTAEKNAQLGRISQSLGD